MKTYIKAALIAIGIAATSISNVATAQSVPQITRTDVVGAVQARLRDPGSARFTQIIRVAPAIACGFVSAKNGFGGYAEPKAFIVAGGSAHARAVFQGDNGFMSSWNTLCNGKQGATL